MTTATVKTVTRKLVDLQNLIDAGQTQREYRQARSERYLALTIDLMLAPEDREHVKLVDASFKGAIDRLGEEYCRGRGRVLLVDDPTKLRDKVKPSTEWLGVLPIIGTNADGENVNDGQHRIYSAVLAALDLEQNCVPGLGKFDDLEVKVTFMQGDQATHGVEANKSTEGDTPREDFDAVWSQWEAHPKERRAHYQLKGYNVKAVQFGFLPFTLVWNALYFLRDKVSIFNEATGKKEEIKGTDYVLGPKAVPLSEVSGLTDLGHMLRAFFRASLNVVKIQTVKDLPKILTEAYPFRLTYDRMQELFNCAMVDCYLSLTNPKTMALDAHKRPYFAAAWVRFSKDGWERSAATPKVKAIRNKVAADQVRAMFNEADDSTKAKAEEIAKMFESGTPAPSLMGLVKDAARTAIAPADFFPALEEVLPSESKAKITKGEAYKLAKSAIGATLHEKG